MKHNWHIFDCHRAYLKSVVIIYKNRNEQMSSRLKVCEASEDELVS